MNRATYVIKSWLLSASIAIVGIIINAMCLYANIRFFSTDNISFPLVLLGVIFLPISNGVLFCVLELFFYRILNNKLENKYQLILSFLAGNVLYFLFTVFLFPNIAYMILRAELGTSVIMLCSNISSYIGVIICGMVNVISLIRLFKHRNVENVD